jgi:hypothetical protein
VLDEGLKKIINEKENLKTYDYDNDLKGKDEQINQIISQYQDRMERMRKENEEAELKRKQMNDKIKLFQKEADEHKVSLENEKLKFEESIRDVIQNTSEIVIQMKNTLEVDLSDDSLGEEVYVKIKSYIENIYKEDENSKWVGELRSFISKTLLAFHDIIFKQISIENNFAQQKVKWQNTLDQLIATNQEETNKSIFNILYRIEKYRPVKGGKSTVIPKDINT